MPDRTELVWTYEPRDFFEAPYHDVDPTGEITVEGGSATVALNTPEDPVGQATQERYKARLVQLFAARQIQDRRSYSLAPLPRIVQHDGDRTHSVVQVQAAEVVIVTGRADVLVTDSSGTVIRDSRAERIAKERVTLDLLAAKAARSATVRDILDSYSRSVSDPDNEFVHLYEVRDALVEHLGGAPRRVQDALGIPHAEWKRVEQLANGPIEQGRHRGLHRIRRPATAAELNEFRDIVRRWILVFAETV